MRPGFIAGDDHWRKAFFEPGEGEDISIVEAAGKWIVCPDCDSTDAGFLYWGEGVDMDFWCADCGNGYGVR